MAPAARAAATHAASPADGARCRSASRTRWAVGGIDDVLHAEGEPPQRPASGQAAAPLARCRHRDGAPTLARSAPDRRPCEFGIQSGVGGIGHRPMLGPPMGRGDPPPAAGMAHPEVTGLRAGLNACRRAGVATASRPNSNQLQTDHDVVMSDNPADVLRQHGVKVTVQRLAGPAGGVGSASRHRGRRGRETFGVPEIGHDLPSGGVRRAGMLVSSKGLDPSTSSPPGLRARFEVVGSATTTTT